MKQLALFDEPKINAFGGQLLAGKRKISRPLSPKNALHIVLRAELKPGQDLCREIEVIQKALAKYSVKYGIQIYEDAVASNHIHLLIRIPCRPSYCSFVRATAGSLAAQLKIKWSHRPFTRVVEWGRDFHFAKRYVRQNELEAAKIIPYQPRKR